MPKSYDPRRFPSGPYVEPSFTKTLRGPKRLGPIGDIVSGDDVEVARWIARHRDPRQRVPPLVFHIKLTPDTYYATADPTVGIPYILGILEDNGGMQLYAAELYCTVPSTSGTPTVQLRRCRPSDGEDPETPADGVDMLVTPLTVDVGDYFSADAATPYEIDFDENNNLVEYKDLIAIDLDVTGTGTRGLAISLWFCPA